MPQGVSVTSFNSDCYWLVETRDDGRILFRAEGGGEMPYLHRPDSDSSVTTWTRDAIGNGWVIENEADCVDSVRLKSWKGDYLQVTKEGRVEAGVSNPLAIWHVEPQYSDIDVKLAEHRFEQLLQRMGVDSSLSDALFNSPTLTLTDLGIPTINKFGDVIDLYPQDDLMNRRLVGLRVENRRLTVVLHWWGVDFIMSPELTKEVMLGGAVSTQLSGLIAEALAVLKVPQAAAIAAAVAIIIGLKTLEIRLVSNGKGVHWPISWIQWGVFATYTATLGPPGAALAGAVLFHPFRPEACPC